MSDIELPEAGTCVVCGCTDEEPCLDDDGEPCTWIDQSMTMCSTCAGDAFGGDDDLDAEVIAGEVPDFGPWDDEDGEDTGDEL